MIIIFVLFLLFFPRLISASEIGCLPYFGTWCGLSANLNAGLKCTARGSLQIQDAKNAISAPSHNFVGPYLCN